MNLNIRHEAFTASNDLSWLGSAHGTTEANSLTVAAELFADVFPAGVIPSGVVVVAHTSGDYEGLYGPPDIAADGDAYHLLTPVDISGGNATGAGLWHGEVLEDNLPDGHGLTEDVKSALPQISYR